MVLACTSRETKIFLFVFVDVNEKIRPRLPFFGKSSKSFLGKTDTYRPANGAFCSTYVDSQNKKISGSLARFMSDIWALKVLTTNGPLAFEGLKIELNL